MNKTLACLFLLVIPCQLNAQILPKEGSELHYRLIGFSFRQGPAGCKYKVEVAVGNYNNEDSFKKNIIVSFTSYSNKLIGEVPSFGKQYTWRAVFTNTHLDKTENKLFHFSTKIVPDVDTNVTRLRITKNAEKYKDWYIFSDGARTLYDMNGQPVWFMPDMKGLKMTPRDIKLTPQGTITFLLENIGAYEINYNGDILWKAPDNGSVSGEHTEHYHHEFTRLSSM